MSSRSLRLCLAATLCLTVGAIASASRAATDSDAVIDAYSDIALAMYEDALVAAIFMQGAIGQLIDDPTKERLQVAKQAWIAARAPYTQSEGYRFGNPLIDEWETGVNAWPLDEGLIDYVDPAFYGEEDSPNPLYTANVVANPKIKIGTEIVDAGEIGPELLGDTLHQAQEVKTNVATGYHVIEFLLWGQNIGAAAGGGRRPASDYDTANCTNGNCDRRRAFLSAAVDVLLLDLQEMVANWRERGKARREIVAKGSEGGLAAILNGLSVLSDAELAGERLRPFLTLANPAPELDDFSGNAYNDLYYAQLGMLAIWQGKYVRPSGEVLEGPSIRDYASEHVPEAAERVDAALAATMSRIQALQEMAAHRQISLSRMVGTDNEDESAAVNETIKMLIAQARSIEGVASAMSVELNGAD